MAKAHRSRILIPNLDPSLRGGAAGPARCRCCGRPDGQVVRCLEDGRWYDAADQTWRDGRGRRAAWPDVVEYAGTRDVPVSVRPAHLSGDPDARPRLLCRPCLAVEERLHRKAHARIRLRMRKALGDLFLGCYEAPGILDRVAALYRRRR